MLLLSRERGQEIHIGHDILVSVVDFKINSQGKVIVSLGITAPQKISIWRDELSHWPQNQKPQDDE